MLRFYLNSTSPLKAIISIKTSSAEYTVGITPMQESPISYPSHHITVGIPKKLSISYFLFILTSKYFAGVII